MGKSLGAGSLLPADPFQEGRGGHGIGDRDTGQKPQAAADMIGDPGDAGLYGNGNGDVQLIQGLL